ncbi:hypothetical protein [Rhizobium leguminosarum]
MIFDLQVGLIGVGRLGQAIGRSFEYAYDRRLSVWSRRFAGNGGGAGEGEFDYKYPGLVSATLPYVADHEFLICAIPNWALAGVAHAHLHSFQRSSGLVFLTGADTPHPELATLLPNRTLVRVVPVILPGRSQFFFLACQPQAKSEIWRKGLAFLNTLGSVITVEGDEAFEELMIFTSPLATVIRVALATAIAEFLEARHANRRWQRIAEVIAAHSLSGHDFPIGLSNCVDHIATPGGITEAGLSESQALSQGVLAALHAMRNRADALGKVVTEIQTQTDLVRRTPR